MTDSDHPITLPLELVEKFATHAVKTASCSSDVTISIATQAAQWGYEQRAAVNEAELQKARDEELEACISAILDHPGFEHPKLFVEILRAARRPKLLSSKELNLKHLEVMERDGHYLPEIIADLRRAIESLPD